MKYLALSTLTHVISITYTGTHQNIIMLRIGNPHSCGCVSKCISLQGRCGPWREGSTYHVRIISFQCRAKGKKGVGGGDHCNGERELKTQECSPNEMK